MIVGRMLQILGARIDYEPVGANGRRVDWGATFPDGERWYVEATSPLYNRDMGDQSVDVAPLLDTIEALTPDAPKYSSAECHASGRTSLGASSAVP